MFSQSIERLWYFFFYYCMSYHLKIYYTWTVTWRLIHKLFLGKTGLCAAMVLLVVFFSCCFQYCCVGGEQTSAFRQWHLLPKYLALNWNALWKHFFSFTFSSYEEYKHTRPQSWNSLLYCYLALPCRRHRRLLFFRKSINKTESLKPHRSP